MTYQSVILMGNLGKDPEMKYTQDGTPVTNFSLAIDDGYKDKSGTWVKRTLWARVVAWGKLAEFANTYLAKGRKVLVEGSLVGHYETGEDQSNGPKAYMAKDGTPKATFEIRANIIKFADSKNGGSSSTPAQGQSVPADPAAGVPF